MSSPTQRTLKHLRKLGYTVGVTEKWNQYARIRQDLFGFIDMVAIHPSEQHIIGVQATSGSNHSKRVEKIIGIPEAKLWIESGGEILVVSWTKKGKVGKRKIWTVREQYLTESDFAGGGK